MSCLKPVNSKYPQEETKKKCCKPVFTFSGHRIFIFKAYATFHTYSSIWCSFCFTIMAVFISGFRRSTASNTHNGLFGNFVSTISAIHNHDFSSVYSYGFSTLPRFLCGYWSPHCYKCGFKDTYFDLHLSSCSTKNYLDGRNYNYYE